MASVGADVFFAVWAAAKVTHKSAAVTACNIGLGLILRENILLFLLAKDTSSWHG
jgi:hypothetical protein